MTKTYFSKDEQWDGGNYELSIQLGVEDDDQIEKVLQTILSSPSIEGYYLERDKEPDEQEPVTSVPKPYETGKQAYCLALMPNEHRIVCGVSIIREEEGFDWVNIYLPMVALSEAYPVGGYPFDKTKSSKNWQKSVDEWLAVMGKLVFANVPYSLGLIGYEVSGETDSKEIAEHGIPEVRYITYLHSTGEDLRRYSKNQASTGFS
ncbi:MAG: hypothetical protein JEZ00_17155 [Anaerolineaceae bacterium]|nr:hypothetical protein [Anaerolineaceae bacterium]